MMLTNNCRLTPREIEVLRHISYGLTTKEIAKNLFVSPNTVTTHRKNLLIKFDAKNIAGLVRNGFEMGVLTTT